MRFGPWHPDASGLNTSVCVTARNCLPAPGGFAPLRGASAATGALGVDYILDQAGSYITDQAGSYISSGIENPDARCQGAVVVFDDDGAVHTFAGAETRLYKLASDNSWLDVSRVSGGDYSAGLGERWQFGAAGGLVIAVTIGDDPQKFLLGSSSNFEPLGGTPPRARFITTVGEFIVLAGLFQNEYTVHWSGLANAEHWTPGTQSCDYQTFQNGGPVRGIVGGEVGYVFQAETVRRMTFVPGSDVIFQFDEVEGGRGLAAPYSLVKIGNMAFYLAPDGFYKFALIGGTSTPLGVGKWATEFVNDLKAGSERTVLGGVDPVGRFVMFAYNSADNPTSSLNRVLIYNWALDEATTAEMSVSALTHILTTGVTLDTLDSYGTLDSLPFSLDSPVWRGGASLLGVFLDDEQMSTLSGPNMSATIITSDTGENKRALIKGVRPSIDTRQVTAAIAAREAEGDPIVFGPAEPMADTGVIPTWASGFVARARTVTAEGADWTKMTGLEPVYSEIGRR